MCESEQQREREKERVRASTLNKPMQISCHSINNAILEGHKKLCQKSIKKSAVQNRNVSETQFATDFHMHLVAIQLACRLEE